MTINDMTVGSRLRFGTFSPTVDPSSTVYIAPHDIIWKKVSEESDFITEFIEAYYAFDVPEVDNTNKHRVSNGNNFYQQSNIHQWLNSDGSGWFTPSHEFDVCPESCSTYGHLAYGYKEGFLSGFDKWEQDLIVPREITCAVPSGSRREFGTHVTFSCKVALPSLTEMGVSDKPVTEEEEGKVFQGITSQPSLREAVTQPRLGRFICNNVPKSYIKSSHYMLRTANVKSDCSVYAIDQYSRVSALRPKTPTGVRPVIRLKSDHEVLLGTDGYYTLSALENEMLSREDFMKILNQ